MVLFLFDTEAFSYILFFRHKTRAKVYISWTQLPKADSEETETSSLDREVTS